MGGYGAFKLALRQPERFAAAASLSGGLNLVNSRAWDDPSRSAEMRRIFGDRERFAGSENDLYPWLEKVARGTGPKPRLYQCCGTEDFLYEHNIHFRDCAQALDYPGFIYEEGPGAHKWEYWDTMIRRVLEWFGLIPAPPLNQP
jgi:S-formylglutathione hydrolase FrmB